MTSFPEEWVNEQPKGDDPLGEEDAGLEGVGEELGLDEEDDELDEREDERYA